jgi:hypothetical protein
MAKEDLRISANNVFVEIKRPISTEQYTRKKKDQLMARVRKSICESFDRGPVRV